MTVEELRTIGQVKQKVSSASCTRCACARGYGVSTSLRAAANAADASATRPTARPAATQSSGEAPERARTSAWRTWGREDACLRRYMVWYMGNVVR